MVIWFRNLSLMRKLLIIGLPTMVTIVTIVGTTFYRAQIVADIDHEIKSLATLRSGLLELGFSAQYFIQGIEHNDRQRITTHGGELRKSYQALLTTHSWLRIEHRELYSGLLAITEQAQALMAVSPADPTRAVTLGEALTKQILTLNVTLQQIFVDSLDRKQRNQPNFRRSAFSVILAALLIFLGTPLVIRWVVILPLKRFVKLTRRYASGELSLRAEIKGHDELGMLGEAFNNMAATIQESQAKLEYFSTRDGLTGVHNNRAFTERLSEEMARQQRNATGIFSLIMVDIDYFKAINDTYGHLAGDQALREAAGFMSQEVRTSDFVARYGGEEFVILLPDTALDGAVRFAERLRERLAVLPIRICAESPIHMTISLGVASFPVHADSTETLIRVVDHYLYMAKHHGRNRVCFPDCSHEECRQVDV